MFADRGVGTPEWLQCSVLVVSGAVSFAAEEAMLEGMLVGNVGMGMGFEDREFVHSVRCGAKEAVEE